MSSPSDNGAFGKHSLCRLDPISSHQASQYPTFPSLQKTRKILGAPRGKPGLNANLGLHPSSNIGPPQRCPRYVNIRVIIWSTGKYEIVVSAFRYGVLRAIRIFRTRSLPAKYVRPSRILTLERMTPPMNATNVLHNSRLLRDGFGKVQTIPKAPKPRTTSSSTFWTQSLWNASMPPQLSIAMASLSRT